MAIIKQSTFPALGPAGEPLVRLLSELPGYGDSLEKTAGVHPEILAYKSQLEPEPGKTYVHILALGAGEYYGANLNNDHFPWQGLQHDHTRTPHPHLHGYKTFLNAHAFAHHMNTDPEKAYGDVLLSVLNTKMKRVELIVAIDEEKCVRNGGAKTLERIKAGEHPSTSMGCRVPFDVCSICEHKAKYRSEYCDHMRSEAGKIYSDGRKVFVYNPYPRFFDISFVFIGADRTSFVLERIGADEPASEKVAYVGEGLVNTVKGLNWTTKGMLPRFAGGAIAGGLTAAMTAEDGQRPQALLRGALAGGALNATVGQVARSGLPGAMGIGLTAGGMVGGMGAPPPPPPLSSTLDPSNSSTTLNGGHEKTGASAEAMLRKKLRRMSGTVQPFIGIRLHHKVEPVWRNVPTAGKVRMAVRQSVRETAQLAENARSIVYANAGAQRGVGVPARTAPSRLVPVQDTNARVNAAGQTEDVMSEKRAAMKAAEVQKVSDIFKDVNSLPMGRAVPLFAGSEPDIPCEMLDRVANTPDIGEALGGFGAAGVVLKPHEFQRVMLRRMGQDGLADDLHSRALTFDPSSAPVIRSMRVMVRPPDAGAIPLGLMDMLRTILPMRSALSPLGMRRQITITISSPEFSPMQHPILDKLAGLYNGYREDLLLNAEQLMKTAMHTPQLMREVEHARGGQYAGGPDMRALAELPMAYFSHAYWNRCCCDRSLSDEQFAEKFVDENPEIAKYLARVVAQRYDSI